ncbi:hypothetical protein N7456_007797 [Penicillium angulare]|uniref:Uncharacterized protein n=1 Tax=Penicillium angulare TaxID=116970 RepID=A0A9W9FBH6_9EURO|nr:hypothetical protein N7456_007797 [Penicillium angulare]
MNSGTGGLNSIKKNPSTVKDSGQRHDSRTLDQYLYSSLPNTVRRDADQVIRRYQARKRSVLPPPPPPDEPTSHEFQDDFKLCMVDQLWLWVLDDKTIITCFPHSEKDPKSNKDHQESPLDRIRHHINQEPRPQIKNVYHLAALITSFCVSSIDECQAEVGPGKETLFDMFADSIGFVADREVKGFNSFRNGLTEDDSYQSLEQDIELLEEVKDIRDELSILERILDEQKDLTQRLFGLVGSDGLEGIDKEIINDPVMQYYHQRAGVEFSPRQNQKDG